MVVNIDSFFEELKKLDLDFLKSNKNILQFFYLMMPKKTCNCPSKPKVVVPKQREKAIDIYRELNTILPESYVKELKNKLGVNTIGFEGLHGTIIFKL